MKINNVTGYFDCRQFKANTPKSNRVMIENGGRITFTVPFTDEEIEEYQEIKEFAKKSEKSGLNYVSFKIFPKACRMYTAAAKQIEFPANSVLDGGKFEVNLEFNVKHGVGTKLNGCYVNAIQVIQVIRKADNPFDVVEGGNDDWINSPQQADPFDVREDKRVSGTNIHDEKKVSKNGSKVAKNDIDEKVDDLPF